ncbi:MAG: serine/threonine protein kinase, partial [Verrucomicrobiota bacterium]|nr:serine/threonine protein kinase [Verrucomicrobiota bacterium]
LRAEKERKVFQPEEISAWTAQLCDALDYAHNHARIIHRDLKPANLMVNQKGDLKVSDFGIAHSIGDSMSKLTMEQGRSGTLVYMSPQQLDGERGTHLDDIYSLGATLYDLLTGKPPFYSGNIDRQIHERVAPSMTERRKEFNVEPALVPGGHGADLHSTGRCGSRDSYSQAAAADTLWGWAYTLCGCDYSGTAANQSDMGSDPQRSSLSGIGRGKETVNPKKFLQTRGMCR